MFTTQRSPENLKCDLLSSALRASCFPPPAFRLRNLTIVFSASCIEHIFRFVLFRNMVVFPDRLDCRVTAEKLHPGRCTVQSLVCRLAYAVRSARLLSELSQVNNSVGKMLHDSGNLCPERHDLPLHTRTFHLCTNHNNLCKSLVYES